MDYVIRDLQNYDEMVALRHLQQQIWGLDDPNIGLYPPLLTSVVRNGGLVLGAFNADSEEIIAFLFSYLGRTSDGPLKMCSQTMGVHKAWRGHGIAEALKQTQRERTRAAGLPLITWTYDPLEAPNAYLNLHKLRAIARTYWPDFYGENFGTLNQGLPTDRLIVEWWVEGVRLDDDREVDWDMFDESPAIFEIMGRGSRRHVVRANLALDTETVLLEIPENIHPIKSENIELALDWRMKVRKAFETYFGRGYIATDLISTKERSGERRNRYLLQRTTPELSAEIGIE